MNTLERQIRLSRIETATWSEQQRANYGLERTWKDYPIDILHEASDILESRKRSILATIRAKENVDKIPQMDNGKSTDEGNRS